MNILERLQKGELVARMPYQTQEGMHFAVVSKDVIEELKVTEKKFITLPSGSCFFFERIQPSTLKNSEPIKTMHGSIVKENLYIPVSHVGIAMDITPGTKEYETTLGLVNEVFKPIEIVEEKK